MLVAKLFEAHSTDKHGDAMLTMEHLCELEQNREHRKELERQAKKKIKEDVWAKREQERLETERIIRAKATLFDYQTFLETVKRQGTFIEGNYKTLATFFKTEYVFNPENLLFTDHPYLVLLSPIMADMMLTNHTEIHMVNFVKSIRRVFLSY